MLSSGAEGMGISMTVTLKPSRRTRGPHSRCHLRMHPSLNVFDLPAGTKGVSVRHGCVALLHPLRTWTHAIVSGNTITNTIIVKPRGKRE